MRYSYAHMYIFLTKYCTVRMTRLRQTKYPSHMALIITEAQCFDQKTKRDHLEDLRIEGNVIFPGI